MNELTKKEEYTIAPSEYIAQGLEEITNANLLTEENMKAVASMRGELAETWQKERIWRTVTEMKYSVLDDVKHPTWGMKYLQARREQNVFFQQLMYLSTEYKETQGKLLVAQAELEELEGKWLKGKKHKGLIMQKEAEIQRLEFNLMEQRKAGHHRVRELKAWSEIKDELIEKGGFDPDDYEGIQMKGLELRWERQIAARGQAASHNIVGCLEGIKRDHGDNH